MNAESTPGRDYSQKDSQTLKEEVGGTLRKLIKGNFPSASSFARCIGRSPHQLNTWQSGLQIPNPDNMGVILQTLKSEGEKLYELVDPWGELIARKKQKRRETNIEKGRKNRKEATTPLGKWVDKVCEVQKISLNDLATHICAAHSAPSGWRLRKSPDLDSIVSLLLYAEKSELPEELKEELRRVITEIVKNLAEKGIKVRSSTTRLRTAKKSAACKTYTGGDVAEELETTRETIRKLRNSLGIENMLLTESNREKIREKFDENKRLFPNVHRGKRELSSV